MSFVFILFFLSQIFQFINGNFTDFFIYRKNLNSIDNDLIVEI